MTPQYESAVVAELYAFLEKESVYKGLRSVYWCIHDETALAEAEVEYETHVSPTVWVKYRLQSDPRTIDPQLADRRIQGGKPISTIIWTTTPWTLPASMAVAFHPDEEYVALETDKDIFLVAEPLSQATAGKCGFPDAKLIARIPGRALENTWFYHPFLPWERRDGRTMYFPEHGRVFALSAWRLGNRIFPQWPGTGARPRGRCLCQSPARHIPHRDGRRRPWMRGGSMVWWSR